MAYRTTESEGVGANILASDPLPPPATRALGPAGAGCTAESGEEGWVGWEAPRFNAFIGLLEFTNDSVVSRTAIMADEEEEKEQFIRPHKTMRAEMPEEMQDSAILHINKALDRFKTEKDVATYMKKTFDEEHGARGDMASLRSRKNIWLFNHIRDKVLAFLRN
jgi:hypothetical protein